MKLRWLLFLFLCGSAHAATGPYMQHGPCLNQYQNSGAITAADCPISNTKAGQLIVGWGTGAATTITITSATETLGNCVTGSFASNGWQTTVCSVIAASDHATFNVHAASSGGFNRVTAVAAIAINIGAGASFDTSCNAGTVTCNLTTTAAGDLILGFGQDLSREMTLGTGMAQLQYGTTGDNLSDSINVQSAAWFKVGGGAGTETVSYTDATSQVPSIVGYAFKMPNPPVLPTTYVRQTCTMGYPNTTRNNGSCPLHGYLANNNYAFGYSTEFEASGLAGCLGSGCNCTAAAQVSHVYATQTYFVGMCNGSVASNQATLQVGVQVHTGSGQTVLNITAAELVGTNAEDTGARAAAAALTTNYTAAGNDITLAACFDNAANPMVPSGTADQSNGTANQNTTPTADQLVLTMQTVAAGSRTTACSETGSNRPMIGTISFGITVTPPNVPRKKGWMGK